MSSLKKNFDFVLTNSQNFCDGVGLELVTRCYIMPRECDKLNLKNMIGFVDQLSNQYNFAIY